MEPTPYNVSADSQNPNEPVRQAPEIYKFSSDELRVLKQCNLESFYQRSMPLGIFLGLGTHLSVKSGYFRAHPRFGSTPKVCVAVIAGYFLGKISYQQKCAEKLMALPNSHIGEVLRQRKRQGLSDNSISLDPGFTAPIGLDTQKVPTDMAPKQSYLDMDSERPPYVDFDRPPQEDSYDVSAIPVPPGGVSSTTYEELRKRNRDEFDAQKNKPYSTRPAADQEDVPPVVRARPTAPTTSSLKTKNKYGDEWEQ